MTFEDIMERIQPKNRMKIGKINYMNENPCWAKMSSTATAVS